MITREELLELAQIRNTPAVSVFIPTHRAGKETLNGEDALKLKNQLKAMKRPKQSCCSISVQSTRV